MADGMGNSGHSRSWSWKAFVSGLVVTTVFVIALAPDPPANPLECPHDPEWESGEAEERVQQFTGGQDDVPEFNDCQKFIIGEASSPSYDSLYAIFASWRLNEFFVDGTVELKDGFVNPLADSGNVGGTAATDAGGLFAVALISAWGNYEPLKIQRGFNCLILKGGGATPWAASMVFTDTLPNCALATEPRSARWPGVTLATGVEFEDGEPLTVHRVAHEPHQEVPPVARWGFDMESWQQYIVIKCGAGTCFIGSEKFSHRNHLEALDGLGVQVSTDPAFADPVYSVAGWHDVQLLAKRPSLMSRILWALFRRFGVSRPLVQLSNPPIWGSVMPDPDLVNKTDASFSDWVPIALVALSAHSDEYAEKANFGATTEGVFNEVHACLDKGGNCSGAEDVECFSLASEGRWISRHKNAETGEYSYFCVTRNPLGSDVAQIVPGTVRWRWLAEDETLWFRCPEGCCTPE